MYDIKKALKSYMLSASVSTLDIYTYMMDKYVRPHGFVYRKDPSLYMNVYRTIIVI